MKNLEVKKTSIFRQKINSCFKKCCKLNREERLFAKARSKLDDEIDIIKFLKKIRRIEAFERELTARIDLDKDALRASLYTLVSDGDDENTAGFSNNDSKVHPTPEQEDVSKDYI